MNVDAGPLILEVNGRATSLPAECGDTLLTVLREQMLITSPKRGCNQGVCGSCTVLRDGRPVRACLSLAAACAGHAVQTIEGLARDRVMQALQKRFAECGAVQCGFCTAGMLISAWRLLTDEPRPTASRVQDALSGNLCRCTGYRKIVDAVLAAAEDLGAKGASA